MDDLISRKAAVEAIAEIPIPWRTLWADEEECEGMERMQKESCEKIRSLPSAQPERCEDCANLDKTRLLIPQPEQMTGVWIVDGEYIDCSACKREKWSRVPYENLVKGFKYCPNCGAKMEG